MNNLFHLALVALLTMVLTACTGETPSSRNGAESAEQSEVSGSPTAPQPVTNTFVSELGGTSWQLVKIMSMDDTTHVPLEPSFYTLAFEADGTMNLVADCNHGAGSWTSESKGQLQFSTIAATMAVCTRGSLHDKYLAQFAWVRSYVLSEGHLFLSTMADGAIIEFEPVDPQ